MKTLAKSIAAVAATSVIATCALVAAVSALTNSTKPSDDDLTLGGGYWCGSFNQADISSLYCTFSKSTYATLEISSGVKAKITGKVGSTNLFKEVDVTLVGEDTSKFSYKNGTVNEISTTTESPGIIMKSIYTGLVRNGKKEYDALLGGYKIQVDTRK